MSVLMPVTSTGRRGIDMGGQVSLATRYTRKAPRSPAKNIVSAPINISIPKRALFSEVPRRSSSSPWRSPSPSSSGGSGANGGGPCVRVRTSTGSSTRPSRAAAVNGTWAIALPPDPLPHQQAGQGNNKQEHKNHDQDNYHTPVLLPHLVSTHTLPFTTTVVLYATLVALYLAP